MRPITFRCTDTLPLSPEEIAGQILDPANWNEWLDPATTPERAEQLLSPPIQTELELVRIGPAVNKVANDGPEIQEPAGEREALSPPIPARRAAARPKTDGDGGQGSLFD